MSQLPSETSSARNQNNHSKIQFSSRYLKENLPTALLKYTVSHQQQLEKDYSMRFNPRFCKMEYLKHELTNV